MTTDTDPRPATTAITAAMTEGRRADSARRRHRVLTALSAAINSGDQISVSGIARAAAVDRTFLYRHRELLEQVHAAAAQPPATTPGGGPAVTRASLQADLLAAQQRATRMAARTTHLETRLSALLGEHAWRESGLGAPTTSTSSNSRSSPSNSASSTYAYNSKNAIKTSPPHAPPTANSWPKSTPDTPTGEHPQTRLHHTCCTRYRLSISL